MLSLRDEPAGGGRTSGASEGWPSRAQGVRLAHIDGPGGNAGIGLAWTTGTRRRSRGVTIFRWRCAEGIYPFPSRTRWSRPQRPMVLYWRRYGRAGGCRILFLKFHKMTRVIWGCSSVGRAPALQAGGQEFESLHLQSHGLPCTHVP